ncbi:T9SS type A sorting domain-containing protein [candidate division KSB1 bacterium]|nr:T9SS type A sorting domain-containing protein [candidate division KSB1 bacterium]
MMCQKLHRFYFSIIILVTIFSNSEIKSQTIKISWNLNPENDVKYYCIFKKTTSGPESEIAKVSSTDSSYLDHDIVLGQTYAYRVTAEDTAGNESEFSDEVSILAGDPTPVELVSFHVEFIQNKCVLKWETASESNNYGFEIQRSESSIQFITVGFVRGTGTATTLQRYQFTDRDAPPGKHYYRLKQIDTDGSFSYSSIIATELTVPQKFELYQNYPNPFNPETTIKYALPENGHVRLIIYDILGREVIRLVDECKPAGFYEVKWDGRNREGIGVGAGVYIFSLFCNESARIKKLIMEK